MLICIHVIQQTRSQNVSYLVLIWSHSRVNYNIIHHPSGI